MNTGKTYKTRQRECILECIRKKADAYITIAQLSEELEKQGRKVGLTTIYRTLDKLEQEHAIAKISIDGVGATCYRILPQKNDVFFSMKCEKCGNVININCSELSHLYSHVSNEHHIAINPGKTMFYGICESCVEQDASAANEGKDESK